MTLIYPGGGYCDPNDEPCVGPDCPPTSVGDPDNPINDGCLINCGTTTCTGPDCVNGQCVGPNCSYGEDGDWHVYWLCDANNDPSSLGEVIVAITIQGGVSNILSSQEQHFKESVQELELLGLSPIQIGDTFQYDANNYIGANSNFLPQCFTYLGKKFASTPGNAVDGGGMYSAPLWANASNGTSFFYGDECECQGISEPPQPETGCQDPSACNYSELATIHDQTTCCYVTGCTDTEALNYNLNACCDDGSCCFVGGCTDAEATNYDPSVCYDDGSCCYVQGCMDPLAFNYDALACSTAECEPTETGCTDIEATNYNPSANTDDGSCEYSPKDAGCTVVGAVNYDPNALTANDNLCEWHIPRFCLSDVEQPTGVNPLFSGTSNTNDAYLIFPPTAQPTNTSTLITIANMTSIKDLIASLTDPYLAALEVVLGTLISPGDNITYVWGGNKTACITFLGYDVYYGDGMQTVSTAISPTPILLGPMTNVPTQSFQNINVTSIYTSENVGCGNCSTQPSGCTDATALNYDPLAIIDDSSCTYGGVLGCTNDSATNYNSSATIDDGSCLYVAGCLDATATNFSAGVADCNGVLSGSNTDCCNYPVVRTPGCTDPLATNYDPLADLDDGSCIYRGTSGEALQMDTPQCVLGGYDHLITWALGDSTHYVEVTFEVYDTNQTFVSSTVVTASQLNTPGTQSITHFIDNNSTLGVPDPWFKFKVKSLQNGFADYSDFFTYCQ